MVGRHDSFSLKPACARHPLGADGTLLFMNRDSVGIKPYRIDTTTRTEGMAAGMEAAIAFPPPMNMAGTRYKVRPRRTFASPLVGNVAFPSREPPASLEIPATSVVKAVQRAISCTDSPYLNHGGTAILCDACSLTKLMVALTKTDKDMSCPGACWLLLLKATLKSLVALKRWLDSGWELERPPWLVPDGRGPIQLIKATSAPSRGAPTFPGIHSHIQWDPQYQ